MNVIDSSLFLGFPMDDAFALALKRNKTEYLSFFIHHGSAYLDNNSHCLLNSGCITEAPPSYRSSSIAMNSSRSKGSAFCNATIDRASSENFCYLEEVDFQGIRYLGKYVNNEEPLANLDLLEANIFSILKKLVSEYPYQDTHLVLFTIPHYH